MRSAYLRLLSATVRENELARIDASALAAYLMTVLPSYGGLGDRQPVVVDVCSGTVRRSRGLNGTNATHEIPAQTAKSFQPCLSPETVALMRCSPQGALAVPLAQELAENGVIVYAAERQRHLVDFTGRRAAAAKAPNAVPVFCEDTLDGVPVAADALVFAAAWTELLTDDEEAFAKARGAAAENRKQGAAVLCVG